MRLSAKEINGGDGLGREVDVKGYRFIDREIHGEHDEKKNS
jgi:hypothetical protein